VAANRQQGYYLTMFLTGFTILVAGLAAMSGHPGIGIVAALAGLILLVISIAGFYRIKRLEFTE
jgi:hypothetical protein